jgi:hypothetical protein
LAAISALVVACDRGPKPTGTVGPQVLVMSGLAGTWAVDCALDASRENPYIRYTVPASGEPAEQFIARDPRLDRTTPMRNIRELEGQHVGWTQRIADKSVDVIVKVEGARQRVWQSILSDGTVFVSDGKFGNGAETPWFNKCAGG